MPLHLNKLDLRDYLYNVYGIEALNVRSFIQMQKLRQDRPNAIRTNPRRWFRPKSIKKMTVEMAAPFVWPPEDVESEYVIHLRRCCFVGTRAERGMTMLMR